MIIRKDASKTVNRLLSVTVGWDDLRKSGQ